MFHFIYVLRFKKDKKFYTGYTKNLKLRLEQHQKRLVNSTENRGKFDLVYFEGCIHQKDATHREAYLKTYFGKRYIKNRLKSYLTG